MQRLARRVVVLVGTRAASPLLVMPSIPRRGLAVHVPYREHSPLPFHPEALHMCARGPIKWVTSNDTIANMTVIRDHGMLLSSCSMATNVFLDLLMKLCAFCGFRMSAYSSMMARCSNLATQRLVDQAAELGANAVVNVRFQTKATIDPLVWSSTYCYVQAYGTAVYVAPKE